MESDLQSDAWERYSESPEQANLAPLVGSASTIDDRRKVISAMRILFAERRNWRVAQHLALLLSGVHFQQWPRDLVQATYFAHLARHLSNEDPRVLIVEARLFWQRRLPLAVLANLETIEANAVDLERQVYFAEFLALSSLSYAYLHHPHKAWSLIAEKIEAPEAVNQILLALPDGDPLIQHIVNASQGLLEFLAPKNPTLVRYYRGRILSIMRRRGGVI